MLGARAGQAAALFGRRRRPAGLSSRQSRRQLPLPADARRWRWPASASSPSRCSRCASACCRCARSSSGLAAIRSGDGEHARGRAAGRDRAAAVGAQRADPVQPGHRRARPHPGRQPGARPEDAARRHHQRGARATRARSARKVAEQAEIMARPGQPLPRPRAHGGARRRHRPRDEVRAGRSSRWCARWSASTATSGVDINVDCPAGCALPGRAAGPGGDAGQPARQRLQVGAPRGGADRRACRRRPAAARSRRLSITRRRRRARPQRRAARAHRQARPAARRDQARLRPRPVDRHGSRPVLRRQAASWPAPSRAAWRCTSTLPAG